jgi:hypothetical protein
MRIWLFALLAACGGSTKSSPTVSSPQPMQPIVKAAPAKPEMPVCADRNDVSCLITQMEFFTNQMCACSGKSCADGVNEAMSKWGMEIAKNAGPGRDQKPDPAMVKRSTDVMTRYTECMVKSMTADGGPIPEPIPDPCGGDQNPCGD